MRSIFFSFPVGRAVRSILCPFMLCGSPVNGRTPQLQLIVVVVRPPFSASCLRREFGFIGNCAPKERVFQ
uniref:Putative secreted protein n=1 Tax=Anopheles marajoara TaxID=58244 RepID=A0A2M4CEG3_9DIPT